MVDLKFHESEEWFRQLAENIREVFYINDPKKTRILYVNPAYEEIWGRTCESLYEHPMSFVEAIVPEDQKHVIDSFKIQTKGDPVQVEYRILRPDGSIRWISSRAYPVKDKHGELKRIVGIAEDITAYKKTEETLREQEKKLKDKTSGLEEINTALNVLLKKREADKKEVEEKVLFNVKKLILPYIDRLKITRIDARQTALIDILESNLEEIISPFGTRIKTKSFNFTPKEIHVANLVKHGKTTKEIADILELSVRAVTFHRTNLRKKLGLIDRKMSLRSRLFALD